MKRRLICLLLAALCLLPGGGRAANSARDGQSYGEVTGLENCFAWNERYLFAALGFDGGEDFHRSWSVARFRIMRVDLITGEEKTLIPEYPYQWTRLLMDGDDLYIYRKYDFDNAVMRDWWREQGRPEEELPVVAEDETYGTFYIVKLNDDGNIIEQTRYDLTDDRPVTAVMGEHIIYIATPRQVLRLDPREKTLSPLYEARAGLRTSSDALIIEDGTLYVTDGETLMAVDTASGEVRELIAFPDGTQWSSVFRVQRYLVLDNRLYFWDEEAVETAVLHLETGARERLSGDMFLFERVNAAGIAAYRIPEETVRRLYAEGACEPENILANKYNKAPWKEREHVYYAFSDPDSPRFAPEEGGMRISDDDLCLFGGAVMDDDALWTLVVIDEFEGSLAECIRPLREETGR